MTAIAATSTSTSTSVPNNTKRDLDLDCFTAWELFRGTSGISLCGCISREKLNDAILSAVSSTLDCYDTTSDDVDDWYIAYLADEFDAIARQLGLLKDSIAPCTARDSSDAEDGNDNTLDVGLDARISNLLALSQQLVEKTSEFPDATLGNRPEVARDADAATLAADAADLCFHAAQLASQLGH